MQGGSIPPPTEIATILATIPNAKMYMDSDAYLKLLERAAACHPRARIRLAQ